MATFEVKNGLSFMVLAKPAGFQRNKARLCRSAVACGKENFRQSCQSFGKIREKFRSQFALIAARPQNPRDNQPALRYGAQSSSISRV